MNKQEFIGFVETSQEWLRRFLASLCCGDMFKVDEIAQETYIKAYLSVDKIRDENKMKSWLLKIAYHTYLNSIRNSTYNHNIEEVIALESEETSDSAFKYENLYNALNSLPPKERMAVILYYMEGYAGKEIAAFLETNEANVRQALSRGRNRLKLILKDQDYEGR